MAMGAATDLSQLPSALESVSIWVEEKLLRKNKLNF